MRRPLGIRLSLSRPWLATTRALLRDLGARTIVGVNLESRSPVLANAEARALIGGLGRDRVQAVEIGNEPSNYRHFPWYRVGMRAVYARGAAYGFKSFSREFSKVGRVLQGIPLAGPTVAGYEWLANLNGFIRSTAGLTTVTFHRYPLNRCFASRPYERATIANLLSAPASGGMVAGIEPYAALAHAHGMTFRVDELNSVACGGKRGVSDRFASALWALDTLFALAKAGVDGVNVHTFPGAAYQPFAFSHTGGKWTATIQPEYYGLLMFARAAPPGSRLLDVATNGGPRFKAWATLSPNGAVRVVLINKAVHRSMTAYVRLPGAGHSATLQRLVAPRASAAGGISLAGQRFPARSSTGTLTGRPQASVVRPASGAYSVTLPAATAALLTIR